MSYIRVCDICKRPMPDYGCKKYKIKELRSFWETSEWITIDAHEECVNHLISIKRKENGGTDNV